MNLTTEDREGISIIRVAETRMMYPLLADFSAAVTTLVEDGARKVLIDLSPVDYIDSATIGCLMDLYRQITAAGGALRLCGVQRRVETMLTMTGAQNFIPLHADVASAVQSFGGPHAHN
ncbi:MAG: anti-sigma factor antagonist [Luteitalea sp.]|nr:anti-sigma factor antagonist [Luteitalea sp.]